MSENKDITQYKQLVIADVPVLLTYDETSELLTIKASAVDRTQKEAVLAAIKEELKPAIKQVVIQHGNGAPLIISTTEEYLSRSVSHKLETANFESLSTRLQAMEERLPDFASLKEAQVNKPQAR